MRKLIYLVLCQVFVIVLNGQTAVGDTIIIHSFKYGSSSRDTLINFPSSAQTYEKIIMKYNMRCKDNLVSNQTYPNQGCGEWDYSCNTYIVDSSKIELFAKTHPNYLISNYTGTLFPYTTAQLYNYYNYAQTSVTLNTINSENQYTVGTGNTSIPNLLKSDEKSGHSQVLVKASELAAAGLTAGNIDGFILNVANAGGTVNFFRVKMQHISVTNTVLSSGTVTLTGFTQVYNSNYTFVNGDNRVQFYSPFVWDGTSNVLIDFSFTNTQPSLPIVFNGLNNAATLGLYANNGYALGLDAFGQATVNTTMLSTINNELTISLWAYGNASLLPANTSVLYGWSTNPNERQVNVHFPWSNSNIYFDAGFVSGGYDRINKAAVASEFSGQWNHWAFTKNATSGDMKIYLNGNLWHSGTAKTKAMSILNLLLGADNNQANNYKGKIRELTIWDKELAQVDIQNWMEKPIDATHPFYGNLVAYYKMGEGSGQVINDSKNSQVSNGQNLQWSYERGDKLAHLFHETGLRPNVVFLRGNYSMSTNTLIVQDSLPRNPNVVQSFSITSNATVVPMMHDVVTLSNTTTYFEADSVYIYDGDNNVLTGTLAVTPIGTLTVTNLTYYERYPFYNEIMSFVTPYGKGLNLGATGKSWYFDVTDFTPLLQGPKRMVMTLGGQYQEQMDIDFYFIVGTPPRNVLDFNQVWQGTNRTGAASIGSINNETRFWPVSVPTPSNAQFFKIRSTITGHGNEGEFHQNGGVVTHSVNLDGGTNEFSWYITQECSDNVIYPQGGTWVYDRQGWCPGRFSMLKQNDATPYITPGNSVTIDYNTSTPQVANGDYRYNAVHQLVSYGGANHNLDASIIDVLEPSNKVLYSRQNPMCSQPKLVIQNTGSTTVTSIEIDYWLNNSTTKQTYTWTGTLNFMDTSTIKLPIASLWQNGLQTNNNMFNAEIKKVNTIADDYSYNNFYHSPFDVPEQIPDNFYIEIKTNNNYTENAYKLYDENGNIVGTSSFTAANTVYKDHYYLTGCYRLVITDSGNDGLYWWANTSQGSGYARIRDAADNTVKTFQTDFGGYLEYSFTTFATTSVPERVVNNMVSIYPNPTKDKVTFTGVGIEFSTISIIDVLGNVLLTTSVGNETNATINVFELAKGIYFVDILKDKVHITRKLVVE